MKLVGKVSRLRTSVEKLLPFISLLVMVLVLWASSEHFLKWGNISSIIRQNAQIIIGKVRDLADPPDEMEVTFGLKAAGELGNFAVAKASAEANYAVKMTWKREED